MRVIKSILAVVIMISFVACNSSSSKQAKENKTTETKTVTATNPHASMGMGHTTSSEQNNIDVKPENGSITIAELYTNKSKYDGKVVKVRGKITKYNEGIMNKNWAHIQDGTKEGKNFDLTVTTLAKAKLGDVVTFEGKITLNKDFGAGYFYPVIMQDAKLVQ